MAMLQTASAIELDGQPSPGLFRCQASSKHGQQPFTFIGCFEMNAGLYALAPQPPRTWVVGEVIWNFFVEADESASVVVLEKCVRSDRDYHELTQRPTEQRHLIPDRCRS
jgi:hypothetical protein